MSFTQVLNLSISASWLVAAIILARLALRNAPKALHCWLWALVAVRLLLPLSIESGLSLIPSREVIPERYLTMEPADEGYDAPARLEIVTNPVFEDPVTFDTETTVDRVQNWDLFATVIWLAGMGAMAVYASYSYCSIRLRVRMAAWIQGGIWECDEIASPFILGLIRPRIYLPSGLDEGTRGHVLAHETAHLKRLDHIWKPLGFALLTVHWFNPVMWAAYVLLCRDIELACDEKVIRSLDKPAVRAYSEALVRCSVSQRMIAACPLAFGEVGVKGRIKSMLSYKKPGFWIVVIAVIISIAVAVCFLTDPVHMADPLRHIREEDGFTITSQSDTTVTVFDVKALLPEDVLNGRTHTFGPGEIVIFQGHGSTIYIESARMSGDELLLTINSEYEVTESGILILPYRFRDGGREWTAQISELNAAARIREYGPDPAITVAIQADKYRSKNTVFFMLENMNRLTYSSDRLIAAEAALPRLEAIKHEKGYSVTDCQEEPLSFMFYTHWIPGGFEGGYDFADGELVVLQTETTTLQMVRAAQDGDRYRFDFAFTYDLPASGTIVTPYRVDIKGIHGGLRVDPSKTYDYTRSYSGGVELEHAPETEHFTLFVDKAMYDGLDDYISVSLDGVYLLTYASNDMDIPIEEYLDPAEHLRDYDFSMLPDPVDQVKPDPQYALSGSTAAFDRFVITRDLHLIGCEQEVLFPIQRDLGALHVTTLEATPVSEELKQDNLWSWRCEAYASAYLLLQQKDGSLYVLALSEDGAAVTELYRLERTGDYRSGKEAQVVAHSFNLDVSGTFDVPSFRLYSDGTFHLSESVLSSYWPHGSYTLSASKLILKTSDGLYTWCFDVTDEGFVYDAECSGPIRYYITMKEMSQLHDGAIFRSPERNSYAPPALEQSAEEAISEAILSRNRVDSSGSSICVESHRILAELAVCGVAAVDGEPMEELIVYLYASFSEQGTDGERFFVEKSRHFPAVLSFSAAEGGYELLEYRELTEEEAQSEFPDFAWADWEQNGYTYKTEQNRANREKEAAKLDDLQEQIAEAGRLFEIVASSPAQYSYPAAYIDAHPDEWARLIELGAATVHHSFRQLGIEGEDGIKGMLMSLACQEILAQWGEACVIQTYANGPEWFDQFAQHADKLGESMRWEELRRTHPGCALAIVYTEYLIFPPF